MQAIGGSIHLTRKEAEDWPMVGLRARAERILESCRVQLAGVYGPEGELVDAWVSGGWHRNMGAKPGDRAHARLHANAVDAFDHKAAAAAAEWAQLAMTLSRALSALQDGRHRIARGDVDDALDLEYDLTGGCEILGELDRELCRLGFPGRLQGGSESGPQDLPLEPSIALEIVEPGESDGRVILARRGRRLAGLLGERWPLAYDARGRLLDQTQTIGSLRLPEGPDAGLRRIYVKRPEVDESTPLEVAGRRYGDGEKR